MSSCCITSFMQQYRGTGGRSNGNLNPDFHTALFQDCKGGTVDWGAEVESSEVLQAAQRTQVGDSGEVEIELSEALQVAQRTKVGDSGVPEVKRCEAVQAAQRMKVGDSGFAEV